MSMSGENHRVDRFDAVVLGAGPGGEVAVNTLCRAGKRVALVERELIGGECTNWGCIPSKTLLRPPDLKGQSGRVAGTGEPELDFARLAEYRDWMVSSHDDTGKVERYEARGVTVYKADGRIDGPGRVAVGGSVLETEAIVVATGAECAVPPIPGLREAGYWTNREATALHEVPTSAVFIGGGPTAIELSQVLARFGCRVTIVHGPERLLEREEPRLGEVLAEILAEDGTELLLGRRAVGVRADGDERAVELADGSEVRGEIVILSAGRRPRTADCGLETVGIEPRPQGIEIDERCRAADGVWAIGDVTGVAMFTHVAKYQARIACLDILGQPARADYRAVPRVIFTDPEAAAVGLTEEAARAEGIDAVSAVVDLPASIARPYTYEEEPRGELGVVLDREREVLVGAWAVAPLAGEWIHQAVLAIRAEVPLAVLTDTIAQFPSFSEGFSTAVRRLPADGVLRGPDHCAHPRMDEPGH